MCYSNSNCYKKDSWQVKLTAISKLQNKLFQCLRVLLGKTLPWGEQYLYLKRKITSFPYQCSQTNALLFFYTIRNIIFVNIPIVSKSVFLKKHPMTITRLIPFFWNRLNVTYWQTSSKDFTLLLFNRKQGMRGKEEKQIRWLWQNKTESTEPLSPKSRGYSFPFAYSLSGFNWLETCWQVLR